MKLLQLLFRWIKNDPKRAIRLTIQIIQLIKDAVKKDKPLTVDQLPKGVEVKLTEALHQSELTSYYNPHSALLQSQDVLKPMNKKDRATYYELLGGNLLNRLTGIDPEVGKVVVKEEYLKEKAMLTETLK